MKITPQLCFTLLFAATLLPAAATGQPPAVTKTNPMKVYMHYMPWFDAPAPGGTNWGLHWKMGTRNPNIVDATGKRQIASHFYPKIGPYESSDPDVIEYHMLLDEVRRRGRHSDGLVRRARLERRRRSLLVNFQCDREQDRRFRNQIRRHGRGQFLEHGHERQRKPDISKAEDHKISEDNYFNRPEYIRLARAMIRW